MKKWQKLVFPIFLIMAVFIISSGKAEAARVYSGESHTPDSHRSFCGGSTLMDFSAHPSNVTFDIGTGTLNYDLDLQWVRCSAAETRAYAIYSLGDEICPYSGTYGAVTVDNPMGIVTDCVKYVGSPAYTGSGNGLACSSSNAGFGIPGTNAQCVTPVFSGVRQVQNQPPFSSTATINRTKIHPSWGPAPETGSWTVSNQLCQFYKQGAGFGTQVNNSQCITISITVSWVESPPPTTPFHVTADASVIINDQENPTSADFTSSAYLDTGPAQVNDIQITRQYYVVKSGVPTYIEDTSPSINLSSTIVEWPLNGQDVSTYNLGAGDQICSKIIVTPSSGTVQLDGDIVATPPEISFTDESCETLNNTPYVTVLDNDIKVGGTFSGLTADCDSSPDAEILANKNSSVMFAAYALGSIDSQLISASFRPTGVAPAPDGLKFPSFSYYNSCIQNYYGEMPSTVTPISEDDLNAVLLASTVVSPVSFTYSNNYLVEDDGDGVVTIGTDSGAISPDAFIGESTHMRLYVDGDVKIRINGIRLMATVMTDIDQLPSFTLISKGNIKIDPSVRILEGSYIAQPSVGNIPTTGTIDTCNDGSVTEANMYDTCKSQLLVNGTFTAQRVKLNRTLGSSRDASSDNFIGVNRNCSGASAQFLTHCAAELFTYHPGFYLATTPDDNTLDGHYDDEYDSVTYLPPFL